jgi:four helix bundle protein
MELGIATLKVWRLAKDLALWVYRELLPGLPESERWGLADQLRRSSLSVVANIAEGYGRYYFRERIRFCYMARGSLEELATLIQLVEDLGYAQNIASRALSEKVSELRRTLNGYIAYLRTRSKGSNTLLTRRSGRSSVEPPIDPLTS